MTLQIFLQIFSSQVCNIFPIPRSAASRPRKRSRHPPSPPRAVVAESDRAIPSPPSHHRHPITADIRTHRRGATALCHNPVRGACRDSTHPLLTALRRCATTPEPEHDRASGHAIPHHRLAQQWQSMTAQADLFLDSLRRLSRSSASPTRPMW